MRRIARSAIVEHKAEEMFALVDDIEAYPRFLPWCAGAWRFKPLSAQACSVEMSLEYELSGALARVFARLFDRIADTMVDAFTRRADEVYVRHQD